MQRSTSDVVSDRAGASTVPVVRLAKEAGTPSWIGGYQLKEPLSGQAKPPRPRWEICHWDTHMHVPLWPGAATRPILGDSNVNKLLAK